MTEYFVETSSFAAPFISDFGCEYVKAKSPEEALEKVAKSYDHPCGLYAANCYANADAKHKGKKPLAQWLSKEARVREGAK